MIPGLFRFVYDNGMVCGNSFGEVHVPHKGDVVGQVIEGAYEVLGIFDKVEASREAMLTTSLALSAQRAFTQAALTYRYDKGHPPVTDEQILMPRRWEDRQNDLWSTTSVRRKTCSKVGSTGATPMADRPEPVQ